MQEEKKMKVKKGYLAVRVGLDDDDAGFRRFTIPISYLYHPQFRKLLEKAQEVYGFHTTGPLKLPCSVDDFLQLKWLIEREGGREKERRIIVQSEKEKKKKKKKKKRRFFFKYNVKVDPWASIEGRTRTDE
ncbi:hypothetical protein H6P81_011057 [Aristolochia fimbriata]|uniref:Small auxin up regulated protein n=1 Tax=Aristolochia fimbriata TaxID=158543 RepID=A0AAV7ETY1_ARIFI|nr:hypothetical protein H6P81_011057 [Aristolochia fimbriata]